MNEITERINWGDPGSILKFLNKSGIDMVAALTGVLISEPVDKKLMVSHLLQASINGHFFEQVGKTIKKLIELGKVSEDFLDDELHKKSLCDLLKFIDTEAPDEDKFDAMKQLFIKSVSKDSTEQEQILSYQLMKRCRELESGDLLVLKAAYDINNRNYRNGMTASNYDPNDTIVQNWLRNISDQIGHSLKSLVEVHEDRLVNFKLITPRTGPDKSAFRSKAYRLTDLGLKLCEYIRN